MLKEQRIKQSGERQDGKIAEQVLQNGRQENGGGMDITEYEYRGNRFTLEVKKSWYRNNGKYIITGIRVCNPMLYLPESCKGAVVGEWHMKAGDLQGGEKVRRIGIPSGMYEIVIENSFFPNLEGIEVDPGNPDFSTDGKMLFSRDGSKLLYSLAEGNRDRAVVPGNVKKIEGRAFADTRCREIIFKNPEVAADEKAFQNSAWLSGQDNYAVVGNMFFALLKDMKELRVPEGIRRFHSGAFGRASVERLIAPVQPTGKCVEDLAQGYGWNAPFLCRELTLLSDRARVNLTVLRKMGGLAAVNIQEGHARYCSVDGVLFSGDRTILEYYPPRKADVLYRIPEGTVKIAKSAFADNVWLEELEMPDTVAAVGIGAFQNCSRLKKVRFSLNIREIPDAGAYRSGGVFEGCRELKEVTLPEKLQYLGSFAFYGTSLQEVHVNEKLRQIGEYALGTVSLREIHLPAGVERLGKGSLLYADRVSAYEGTAKGLVAAVNAGLPAAPQKSMEWRRCEVTVRRRKSSRTELFLIPGSLKRTMAYHLDMAWNGDRIDYEEYDACFEGITEGDERMEFARLGIERMTKDEASPYVDYMRHSALKIASGLLRQGKDREFLTFLKMGYLSEAALSKLLKLSNELKMTTCSAYLLEALKGKKRKMPGKIVL